MTSPICLDNSFSGMSPTDKRSVSHFTISSLPGTGCRFSSTLEISTASTRSCPSIFVTVCDRTSGMSKSSRHCTMFRLKPPEYGMISTTFLTFAPSSVIRLAIIRPMSPEPNITTSRPGIRPSMFTNFCAVPAEYIPAGLKPGMLSAPRGFSRHPMARITDLVRRCCRP